MQLRSTFGLEKGRLRHETGTGVHQYSARIVFLTHSTDLHTLFTSKNMVLPMKKMRNVLEIALKSGCPGVVILQSLWLFARIPQFGTRFFSRQA
jgi:hypothetical protein